MSSDSILQKLIRSQDDYAVINQEAHRLYRKAVKEPAIFSPHQIFKIEPTPPYAVFDYGMEVDKQMQGHWQASEFALVNFGSWLQDSRPGQRIWMLMMFDTHIYLSFVTKHRDYLEAESFIVVKRDELDGLMEKAEEKNLLFDDSMFDFVRSDTNQAQEQEPDSSTDPSHRS